MNLFNKIIEKIYLKIPNNLAFYDQMTGAYNRNYYERVLKKERSHIYLTLLDFDNLKDVNDSSSHEAGDKLLISVCTLMKSIKNSRLIRLGGDEFLLVSKDDPSEDVERVYITTSIVYDARFSYAVVEKKETDNFSTKMHTVDVDMYKYKVEHHKKHGERGNKNKVV
jgi:diguanylate cyclase (GGDEF)-like protein